MQSTVEVFRTNISDPELARQVKERIQEFFTTYTAHFDLEDCDRILRVECLNGCVEVHTLLDFLCSHGCLAEVLPDEY